MEIKIFNEDNVLQHEINDVVTRVKVFLINNKNQILIANCGGCLMLPGGHVEENESLISTLKREMQDLKLRIMKSKNLSLKFNISLEITKELLAKTD